MSAITWRSAPSSTSFTCLRQPSAYRSHKHAVVCSIRNDWSSSLATGLTGASLAAMVLFNPFNLAKADLNKFEYEAGGEFGKGTALQFGEADIKGKDFSGQDLRRSNFTSADARDANFKNCKLEAAYFIKTVVARANFENANLSDVLMDRAVINDANLKNAILQRAILTRSDLGGAKIDGADFTNALVDRTQQLALCKYADGINPVTGVSTRKSLACGSRRQFKASVPSNPEGPQVSKSEKDAFNSSVNSYRD